MKKTKLIVVITLIALPFMFINCSKVDDPDTNAVSMSANVDGTDWSGKANQAVAIDGILNISGITESGSVISITIRSLDPGTYILNNTSIHVAVYTEDMVGSVAFTTNGNAESGGEVIISDISISDSTISGTFSFKVYRPIDQQMISITNGKFTNIKFNPPVGDQICIGNGENTYLPIADGNMWHYYTTNNMGNTKTNYIGIETVESKQYYKIKKIWNPGNFIYHDYYRFASNKDLYIWRSDINDNRLEFEELYVPANPTLGQSWVSLNNSQVRYEVNSLDASYTTNECSYTGLLEINKYFEEELQHQYYFKKGIGLVNEFTPGLVGHDNYLSSVVLNDKNL